MRHIHCMCVFFDNGRSFRYFEKIYRPVAENIFIYTTAPNSDRFIRVERFFFTLYQQILIWLFHSTSNGRYDGGLGVKIVGLDWSSGTWYSTWPCIRYLAISLPRLWIAAIGYEANKVAHNNTTLNGFVFCRTGNHHALYEHIYMHIICI